MSDIDNVVRRAYPEDAEIIRKAIDSLHAEVERQKKIIECWRDKAKDNQRLRDALSQSLQAICFTRDYVGEQLLPPIKGWCWYDAGMVIAELMPEDTWVNEFKLRVEQALSTTGEDNNE